MKTTINILKLKVSRRILHASSEKGFSFVELIVVTALIGIMAAVATPQLLQQMPALRAKTAARQVMSKMLLLKMRAVSENRSYQILFTATGNQYTVKQDGITVLETETLPSGIIFASNATKKTDNTGAGCVNTLGVCFTDNAVNFTPTGTAKEGAAGATTMTNGASVYLIPREDWGTARTDRMRAVSVDGVGRVKIWQYVSASWVNL